MPDIEIIKPSHSRAEHKFMEAVAHGMKPKDGGPSQSQAKEFADADEHSEDWKKRQRVARKAEEQAMTPEMYTALHGT